VAPDVTPGFLIRSNIKKARKGSVVYTDQCMAYDGMMYYGYHHALVAPEDHYPKDYIYLNRENGFWTWARDRLIKYYGVSSLNFPLYIKELEFRYNHRDLNFFDIMTKYICDLIPISSE
jgi:transposase